MPRVFRSRCLDSLSIFCCCPATERFEPSFSELIFEVASSIGIKSSLTIALAVFFRISRYPNDLFLGIRPRRLFVEPDA